MKKAIKKTYSTLVKKKKEKQYWGLLRPYINEKMNIVGFEVIEVHSDKKKLTKEKAVFDIVVPINIQISENEIAKAIYL